MSVIDKKTLEHLAELARIELNEGEEEKLLKDLKNILGYFNELKELNTEGVEPLSGGVAEVNVFRDDVPDLPSEASAQAGRASDTGKGKNQFPEVEKGYLKVPPVFE
ncbi:hypothetical protein A3A20_00465 [Candidatus Wolfebacteria bacterium RIFCSPLOWO2_01_FULL_45_19]|uniref:Aspartyl/glutamyl-tRNA(Asn/Gln) amidotransferase subunit C n=1 Tax=Candidatus Wolfebacteria bacterium RIFCSPLOWO2_01_FULL_45_19 TaxID=1802557 RepID=A0A1F8DTA1_9BACT|nr:MAG: hypothetical protein A3A20_00465 [Candidatus Wolfebacteria bacterium RIFCSPLOWO2_01_FULL_45_19]